MSIESEGFWRAESKSRMTSVAGDTPAIRGRSLFVIRGGSWNNEPDNVRSANRNRNTPTKRNNNIGFRCAQDACPMARV